MEAEVIGGESVMGPW